MVDLRARSDCGSSVGRQCKLRTFHCSLLVIGVFVALTAAAPLLAQEEPNVGIKIISSHDAIPAGSSGVLGIIYDIPAGFHLQLNDFIYAEVAEPAGVMLGPLSLPDPQDYDGDPVFKGQTILKAPIIVGDDTVAGKTKLKVKIGYQGCAEVPVFMCFAPSEVEREVDLEILAASAAPVASINPLVADLGLTLTPAEVSTPGTASAGGTSLADRVEGALSRGSILAFLLVFVGGIAMSFTPCVLPVIPITVSFIGGWSKGRLHGFILTLIFVLGLALTYSIMGAVAAQTGALIGSLMQSTGVLLFVAAILLVMGISLLGAFDIALPSSLQTRMQGGASRRGGFIGALLLGGVMGLVAAPCVGPVLIVLLAWVAKAGNVFMGFWLLFTFATGIGMLFLVLGTTAAVLQGPWMKTVKLVFGVILILVGFNYLKPVIGDTAYQILLGVFAIFVATFTGAFHRLPEEPTWGMQFRKGLGTIILIVGIFVLGLGLMRAGKIELAQGPALTPGSVEMAGAGLDWLPSDDEALLEAQQSGRPVLVDFYADWCAACRELDEKTWIHPDVVGELKKFILVKLDYTKASPELSAKQSEYGVQGLPTVIMMDSDGQEISRFSGFRGPEEVLEMLRQITGRIAA